jgi:hypothetical protein
MFVPEEVLVRLAPGVDVATLAQDHHLRARADGQLQGAPI